MPFAPLLLASRLQIDTWPVATARPELPAMRGDLNLTATERLELIAAAAQRALRATWNVAAR
jgi:hypothetical protein